MSDLILKMLAVTCRNPFTAFGLAVTKSLLILKEILFMLGV